MSSVAASSVTASAATARLSAEDAWQQLRMPFVLPVAARGLHVCQWELIDMDCAGCTACGCVHRCSASTCTDDRRDHREHPRYMQNPKPSTLIPKLEMQNCSTLATSTGTFEGRLV